MVAIGNRCSVGIRVAIEVFVSFPPNDYSGLQQSFSFPARNLFYKKFFFE